VSIEDAFARVVGRPASDHERQRLYRLRDALGLHDNDAFWGIVMALEYYDSFFRQYPAQLAEETRRAIERARGAFAAAAKSEAARVQRVLSERVAETSMQMARKLADRPVGLHQVTLVLAAATGFGVLCVHAGYSLARTERPFWVSPAESARGTQTVLAAVLATPAGWMIFALLLPVAVQGAKAGWATAADAMAHPRERILGGCILALCVAGCVACAVILARLI